MGTNKSFLQVEITMINFTVTLIDSICIVDFVTRGFGFEGLEVGV